MGITNHFKYWRDSMKSLAQEPGRVLLACLEELGPDICFLGR